MHLGPFILAPSERLTRKLYHHRNMLFILSVLVYTALIFIKIFSFRSILINSSPNKYPTQRSKVLQHVYSALTKHEMSDPIFSRLFYEEHYLLRLDAVQSVEVYRYLAGKCRHHIDAIKRRKCVPLLCWYLLTIQINIMP